MASFPISMCDLPWWAVLLSWLLPALLGYLWGMLQWSRYKTKSKKNELDLASASRRIVNLEKEITECRSAYEKVIREKDKIITNQAANAKTLESKANQSELGSTPTQPASTHVPADILHETRPIFGYAIRRNDLKVIDGIDPKIEKILHEAGIHDWYQLEKTDAKVLSTLVNNAGITAETTTWPYQASLARQEKWNDLKELQSRK